MRAALLNPFFAAFAAPNKWTLPRSVPVDYFRTTGQLSVQWDMLRPLVSLAPRRTKRKRLGRRPEACIHRRSMSFRARGFNCEGLNPWARPQAAHSAADSVEDPKAREA